MYQIIDLKKNASVSHQENDENQYKSSTAVYSGLTIDDSSIPPSRQQILIEQLFDQSGVGSMARGQGGGTLKDTCRELVPQCYKSWSQLHIRIA